MAAVDACVVTDGTGRARPASTYRSARCSAAVLARNMTGQSPLGISRTKCYKDKCEQAGIIARDHIPAKHHMYTHFAYSVYPRTKPRETSLLGLVSPVEHWAPSVIYSWLRSSLIYMHISRMQYIGNIANFICSAALARSLPERQLQLMH